MNTVFRHFGAGLLLTALYFPYFLHLDALPLRLWDESRLACNAREQYTDGFGVVITFEGKPELWNTKPPLMVWTQAALMHLLGPRELAVRLPAAAAGVATSLLLFFKLKGRTGAAAALVLATMPGWVGLHGARTGDYDAPLVFFSTGFLLYFYDYLERGKGLPAAAFAAAGLLTKGVALALCVPGAAIAALILRPRVLLHPRPYVAAAAALLPLLIYYLAREIYDSGYLRAVWHNELGGRYLSTLENHRHPWYFYLVEMFGRRLSLWKFALVLGLLPLTPKIRNRFSNRRLSQYLWITSLTYLAIISGSQTKLVWYDLPIYPLWAGLIAIGWVSLPGAAAWIVALGVAVPCYGYVVRSAYHPREKYWDVELYALPRLLRQNPPRDYIAFGEYRQLVGFYAAVQGMEHRSFEDEFRPGERVLVSESRAWERLRQSYDVRLIKEEKGVKFVEINGALSER